METMQRGVVTPEAVVLEFETGGLGSRLVALSIDLAIQLVALTVVAMAVGLGLSVVSPTGEPSAWVVVLTLLALFGVMFGYPVVFEVLARGRTPGKMALGLRVVTVEGGPVRFRHAAIRTIVGIGEFWFTLGSAAVLAVTLSRRDQRLGDVFAGTLVIRERSGVRAAVAVRFPPPSGWESYVLTLDTSGLSPEHYRVVRSFLLRVDTFSAAARPVLAARLATPVAARLNHRPPAQLGPEVFLACVASAYQTRHGAPRLPWESGPPGPEMVGAAPPWR